MRRFLFSMFAVLALGCRPQIGDDCNLNTDCSPDGREARLCDTTNSNPDVTPDPGGYCTIADCKADACPTEASCVSFQDNRIRFCMRSCTTDADCRTDEAYKCITPDPALGITFVDSAPPTGYCGLP